MPNKQAGPHRNDPVCGLTLSTGQLKVIEGQEQRQRRSDDHRDPNQSGGGIPEQEQDCRGEERQPVASGSEPQLEQEDDPTDQPAGQPHRPHILPTKRGSEDRTASADRDHRPEQRQARLTHRAPRCSPEDKAHASAYRPPPAQHRQGCCASQRTKRSNQLGSHLTRCV